MKIIKHEISNNLWPLCATYIIFLAAMLQIETALLEIETALPKIDTALLRIENQQAGLDLWQVGKIVKVARADSRPGPRTKV